MWYEILKSCHENNSYAWESITVKEHRQVWQGHFVGRFENDEVMHMLHVSTKANKQKTSHLLTYALKMCSLDYGPKQTLDAFFLFYFYLEVKKEQKRKNGMVCGRQWELKIMAWERHKHSTSLIMTINTLFFSWKQNQLYYPRKATCFGHDEDIELWSSMRLAATSFNPSFNFNSWCFFASNVLTSLSRYLEFRITH